MGEPAAVRCLRGGRALDRLPFAGQAAKDDEVRA